MLRLSILRKRVKAKHCVLIMMALLTTNSCFAKHHHQHKIKTVTQTRSHNQVVTTQTVTTVASLPKNDQRLVTLVHETVDNLNYSKYKLGGTKFDASKGVYIVDCSNFVDHLLAKVNRPAYRNLVNSSRSDMPNTLSYYQFFNKLSGKRNHYWNKVDNVGELQAGDILVFRKNTSLQSTGHIMVVMKKPIRNTNTFQVRVADSAPFRHSHDTRLPHVSGIGIGTLLLKVNPQTGKPFAYAWGEGSYFKKNIHFAMARPLDLKS